MLLLSSVTLATNLIIYEVNFHILIQLGMVDESKCFKNEYSTILEIVNNTKGTSDAKVIGLYVGGLLKPKTGCQH